MQLYALRQSLRDCACLAVTPAGRESVETFYTTAPLLHQIIPLSAYATAKHRVHPSTTLRPKLSTPFHTLIMLTVRSLTSTSWTPVMFRMQKQLSVGEGPRELAHSEMSPGLKHALSMRTHPRQTQKVNSAPQEGAFLCLDHTSTHIARRLLR